MSLKFEEEEAIRDAKKSLAYHALKLSLLEDENTLEKYSLIRHHKRQMAKASAFLESVGR